MPIMETRQFAELAAAVMRQLPRDITSAVAQQWIEDQGGLATVLRNALCGLFPCQIHAANLIPKEWTVVEDVEPSDFQVEDLDFVGFLEPGESVVSGTVMCERAVALKANYGLADVPSFLKDQADIPEEVRGKDIVFAGTKVRSPDGRLGVPVLLFHGRRWCLVWYWLEDVWRGCDRLPRSK